MRNSNTTDNKEMEGKKRNRQNEPNDTRIEILKSERRVRQKNVMRQDRYYMLIKGQ